MLIEGRLAIIGGKAVSLPLKMKTKDLGPYGLRLTDSSTCEMSETCIHRFGSGDRCGRDEDDPIHDLEIARLNSHTFVAAEKKRLTPMRFAYADPPYIGQARKHYSDDPKCAEVDHAALITSLANDYDGWALSCKSDAKELAWLISLCKQEVRLGAWVKPFCSFKPNVNPAYAWEPVVFFSPVKRKRSEATVRDWVSANITLLKGVSGAKPLAFAFWLFELLGMKPEDEFVDLFPGSGAISGFWESWKISVPLGLEYCFHADEQKPSLSFDQQP